MRVGFQSKVQVIQRGEKNRQFYMICPAPLAEALELEKGEEIEWVIEDRRTLVIRRLSEAAKGKVRRTSDAG
jgi:bifunctional DNA-binding transcriptional regulator/antitoxin component of YhaV-PrlF toxin-antitoxin module